MPFRQLFCPLLTLGWQGIVPNAHCQTSVYGWLGWLCVRVAGIWLPAWVAGIWLCVQVAEIWLCVQVAEIWPQCHLQMSICGCLQPFSSEVWLFNTPLGGKGGCWEFIICLYPSKTNLVVENFFSSGCSLHNRMRWLSVNLRTLQGISNSH